MPYRRMGEEVTVGERMYAELRKYGECLIAVAQSPAHMSWSAINNSTYVLVHSMMPKDFQLLGLRDEDYIPLRVGEILLIVRGTLRGRWRVRVNLGVLRRLGVVPGGVVEVVGGRGTAAFA